MPRPPLPPIDPSTPRELICPCRKRVRPQPGVPCEVCAKRYKRQATKRREARQEAKMFRKPSGLNEYPVNLQTAAMSLPSAHHMPDQEPIQSLRVDLAQAAENGEVGLIDIDVPGVTAIAWAVLPILAEIERRHLTVEEAFMYATSGTNTSDLELYVIMLDAEHGVPGYFTFLDAKVAIEDNAVGLIGSVSSLTSLTSAQQRMTALTSLLKSSTRIRILRKSGQSRNLYLAPDPFSVGGMYKMQSQPASLKSHWKPATMTPWRLVNIYLA
ncbi:hypothetical protein B9479_000243 [Cryptococcus floricola]|uniref:Uncharacterized protein n=1 Tax=Cryptococcus floricola TaxID=2591691 RepID=A0A5D3B875_9TREE|nr:hypothetical protein B9479_000243 [Cryptococcus floricola]